MEDSPGRLRGSNYLLGTDLCQEAFFCILFTFLFPEIMTIIIYDNGQKGLLVRECCA